MQMVSKREGGRGRERESECVRTKEREDARTRKREEKRPKDRLRPRQVVKMKEGNEKESEQQRIEGKD